jgi:hypothetical protein
LRLSKILVNSAIIVFNIYNLLIKLIKIYRCFLVFFVVKTDFINIIISSDRNIDYFNKNISCYKLSNFFKRKFFFYYLFVFFWKHVIFIGRYFRIYNYRDINLSDMKFGYSHWTKLRFNYFWNFFKVRRKCYLWYCYSYTSFNFLVIFLPFINDINLYTRRGLRFKKQGVKRRFGKISQKFSLYN